MHPVKAAGKEFPGHQLEQFADQVALAGLDPLCTAEWAFRERLGVLHMAEAELKAYTTAE